MPSVDSISLVIEVAIKGNYSVLLLRSGVVSLSLCVCPLATSSPSPPAKKRTTTATHSGNDDDAQALLNGLMN